MMHNERKKQLEKAIQYAIDSNYDAYDRQIKLLKKLKSYSNICVFGMGRFFIEGYPYVKNFLKAKYVCDNNIDMAIREGRETYGLTCIHIEELEKMNDTFTVIMVGRDYPEIKEQLNNRKIKNIFLGDLILNMYTPKHDATWFVSERDGVLETLDLFEDAASQENYVEIICNRIAPHLCKKTFEDIKTGGEYFSTGIFQYSSQDTFVDVGAYIGDTIEQFYLQAAEKVGGYKKIYAFELEKKHMEQLKGNVKALGIENVEIFNLGISTNEDEQGFMTSLDAKFHNEEISLVKMDIEGYEWNALHGGKKVIQKWKPQMAICLYHCLEDLWRIPQYVKELVPEYKLFLRHHSPVVWDSVLYVTK